MIFSTIALTILLIIFVIFCTSVIIGVPFLPTHKKQAIHMMRLGDVGPGTKVVDLGSGAGRLLFLAAAQGAEAVGYELNPFLVWWTRFMIWKKGYSGRVVVHGQSLYQADIKSADVVFAFLFNKPMAKLKEKLFSELKPGAKIISYTFPIPGKTPLKKEQGIYVYQI